MVNIATLLLVLFSVPQEAPADREERIRKKIESIRNLSFQKPLGFRKGSRKEYARLALQDAKRLYGEDLKAAESFLKAFGLIPKGIRLAIAITAQAPIGVQLYYKEGDIALVDPKTDDDTILAKMVTGLLDQHWSRESRQEKAGVNFDAQVALSAVRNGDADLVKNMKWKEKKHDEKMPEGFLPDMIRATEKWEQKESRFKSLVVPRIFVRFSGFPYRRGTIFVESLRKKKGWQGVNQAQETPPRSTEQIIHPEKYLAGEEPVTLQPDSIRSFLEKEGYRFLYRTTLGEFGTAVFFETHDKNLDSAPIAAGWGGDTALVFERNGERTHIWLTTWDTEKDAIEFQKALLPISQKQLPKEPHLTSVVIRRGKSCTWLGKYPMAIQGGLLDSLWKVTCDGEQIYGK